MGEDLTTKIDRYEKVLAAIEEEAMKIFTEKHVGKGPGRLDYDHIYGQVSG